MILTERHLIGKCVNPETAKRGSRLPSCQFQIDYEIELARRRNKAVLSSEGITTEELSRADEVR
jgi:hypothetical protein